MHSPWLRFTLLFIILTSAVSKQGAQASRSCYETNTCSSAARESHSIRLHSAPVALESQETKTRASSSAPETNMRSS